MKESLGISFGFDSAIVGGAFVALVNQACSLYRNYLGPGRS